MAQTAESIVADLIRIALQFVISRTIMFIINKAFGSQESGVANAQAQGAFAAWEPAAIAASTASYGVAAGVGLAAFLAAVASGEAGGIAAGALGGGAATLHEGGGVRRRRMHSGGLAPDEVPIIAQEGEFMIQRDVAQQPGMIDYLMALNAGMFHSGGGIRRLHKGGDEFGPGEFNPFAYGHFEDSGFIPDWMEPPDLNDPDFGPPSTVASGSDKPGFYQGEFGRAFNPFAFMTPGYLPPIFTPGFWQGPTMIPTTFDPQGYPNAVPVWNNPSDPVGAQHIGQQVHSQHTGGVIGRMHLGGSIGRFPRMHSGGSLGGASLRAGGATPVFHIYPAMQPTDIVKHMSSRQGRKVIFDVVNGRRIDLGL
jgi:hypothetical protein